mgnify:CR=1 FL=1
MGRPAKNIDERQVEELAYRGCPNTDIAAVFECDEAVIRKRFSEVVAKGRARRRNDLRSWQWESAKKGNIVMQIFLGKQELGQCDSPASVEDPTVIEMPAVKIRSMRDRVKVAMDEAKANGNGNGNGTH